MMMWNVCWIFVILKRLPTHGMFVAPAASQSSTMHGKWVHLLGFKSGNETHVESFTLSPSLLLLLLLSLYLRKVHLHARVFCVANCICHVVSMMIGHQQSIWYIPTADRMQHLKLSIYKRFMSFVCRIGRGVLLMPYCLQCFYAWASIDFIQLYWHWVHVRHTYTPNE